MRTISDDASKFTLRVPTGSSIETVLGQLKSLQGQETHQSLTSHESDAAVILTTPEFSRWLTNEAFMSGLLSSFASHDTQVLAAVVDDLSPSSPFGTPATGFSVMRGSADKMLPGFSTRSSLSRTTGPPQRGSLSFYLPSAESVSATIPLANTIFQNGLESTLLASSWSVQEPGVFKLSAIAEKSRHGIVCAAQASPASACREIEVDGAPVPASTELEARVQHVYDNRAAADNLSTSGMPVDIWALISTPEAASTPSVLETMRALRTSSFDGPEEEAAAASANAKTAAELLMSGFRLYRISDGGGGWGKRRGRLSLDAEWASSDPAADNLDMMLSSADDAGPAILQRGVVSPGSYIQFVTAPNLGNLADPIASPSFLTSVVLGTSSSLGDGVPSKTNPGEDFACLRGHFGGLSRKHLFLTNQDATSSSQSRSRVFTQIDSPYSYITL
ncbi:unnamed protein product [Parascedosporium putredinis]|uniref:Uncharacterized protein n=1 Tax=Parascedosporium putredinis TaxID=1442378 RepID=A0A9P1H4H2_9PEZI|nr:unnamed protein product [Parascedosporium putredinis]CAI7998270.1 unnamed protein product [Parascedosporium putredinis]